MAILMIIVITTTNAHINYEYYLTDEGSVPSLLRTNGVSTDGAAAKVMVFERLGKKVRPVTFGKTKVGYREYPKGPSVKDITFAATPLVLTPFVPFRGRGQLGWPVAALPVSRRSIYNII